MVIIHFASIIDELYSGVGVVVPQHIKIQQTISDVAFVNVANKQINGIKNQISYKKDFSIEELPQPYNKPDLVVFHEIYYPSFLRIYKQVERHGIPYVVVPHGGITRYAQSIKALKKTVANWMFFNRYLKHARAIHYLSEQERTDSVAINSNTFVVPNGINETEGRCHLQNSVRVFTYIGRIEIFHKGLDYLIEAVDILRERNNEIDFVLEIYGPENDDSESLQNKISSKGLGNYIHYNGKVHGEKKKEILLNTDYFIQTSRFEGMPMGILEALSYGIPCCVTNGTNMAEFVRKYNAGFACENSAEDIAFIMEKALRSGDEYKMLEKNSLKLISDNFSWNIIGQKTIDCYKKLIFEGNKL